MLTNNLSLLLQRSLGEVFENISESVANKVEPVNSDFETISNDHENKKAEYFEEIISRVKTRLSTCQITQEKYLVLSVLPKSWNTYKISKMRNFKIGFT